MIECCIKRSTIFKLDYLDQWIVVDDRSIFTLADILNSFIYLVSPSAVVLAERRPIYQWCDNN